MSLPDRVRAFDERIDRAVPRHQVLDACCFALSSAADHSLLWLAIGGARAARRHDPRLALRMATIMGVEYALTNGLVKTFFRRVRPLQPEAHSTGPLPFGMHRPVTSAFPSGHAASAFTAAMVLARAKRSAPMYFALAAAVAASRVYVRVHHGSDVAAGAALGMVYGAVARRVLPLD